MSNIVDALEHELIDARAKHLIEIEATASDLKRKSFDASLSDHERWGLLEAKMILDNLVKRFGITTEQLLANKREKHIAQA